MHSATLDIPHGQVMIGGKPYRLTPYEGALLHVLRQAKGQFVRAEDLSFKMKQAKIELGLRGHPLDAELISWWHVSCLRRKLGRELMDNLIEHRLGWGYRWKGSDGTEGMS